MSSCVLLFQALSLIFTFDNENGNTSDDSYSWLLDRMPTLPYFDAVLGSLTYALRKVRVADLAEGCLSITSQYIMSDPNSKSSDIEHFVRRFSDRYFKAWWPLLGFKGDRAKQNISMYSITFFFQACSEELNFERLQTYIIFLSKYSTAEFAKDVSVVSFVLLSLCLDTCC